MDKALFIDRDGVLNQDNGYTFKVSDLKILDGVILYFLFLYLCNTIHFNLISGTHDRRH
jgi:histidinol phosphatase-like enzyme